MESLFHYATPPDQCGYLPEETWSLEYEIVGRMTATEYQERLLKGWRRFGHALFRPRCPLCTKCQSIRVDVARFRPDRSQRRCEQLNRDTVKLRIGEPSVTRAKLNLYDRFHAFQSETKSWPEHPAKDAGSYVDAFVRHPFMTEEWNYTLDGQLVGVGTVDALPDGLSAIYFIHEPNHRTRGLGVFNVLTLLRIAAQRGLPYLYLGYFVAGSASMIYKARYRPNQILGADGQWRDFQV